MYGPERLISETNCSDEPLLINRRINYGMLIHVTFFPKHTLCVWALIKKGMRIILKRKARNINQESGKPHDTGKHTSMASLTRIDYLSEAERKAWVCVCGFERKNYKSEFSFFASCVL